jgi:predicted nuclease of predicted toxin-antitoxin system
MKFLVDAQLPRRLAASIRAAGHDAIHTLDLPNGNRTTDSEINTISVQEGCVVVTKDSDFVQSFFLNDKPYKLLLISTGNISNVALEALLLPSLAAIVEMLDSSRFVEVTRDSIIVHV